MTDIDGVGGKCGRCRYDLTSRVLHPENLVRFGSGSECTVTIQMLGLNVSKAIPNR
jgi:hypothetical protein